MNRGGFFEPAPPQQPDSGHREWAPPSWDRPSEGTVPWVLPVNAIVHQNDDAVVRVERLAVYPNGFIVNVAAHANPNRSQQAIMTAEGDARPGQVEGRRNEALHIRERAIEGRGPMTRLSEGVLAVIVASVTVAACSSGSATSATTTTTLALASKFVLLGDGIGAAHFGQAEGVAILELDQVLGRPGMPINEKGNCTVDSALQWSTVTAYFDKDVFVGYSTSFANGYDRKDPNVTAARGLRVGDTLAQARQLYGSDFRTSLAQGGSWFVTTHQRTLDGYLTNEANRAKPVPRIATIEGGSVGCPAASP